MTGPAHKDLYAFFGSSGIIKKAHRFVSLTLLFDAYCLFILSRMSAFLFRLLF